VRLTSTRQGLGEEFLAGIRCVAAAATVCVAAHVAVGVADVVFVFFLEFLVGDELEAAAPEDEAFVEAEADAFEEEGVLQTPVVLEMRVVAQSVVQVAHAEGEVLGQCVDAVCGDGGETVDVGVGGGVGGVGRCEGLGEVGEDGGEAVVFVEAGEGAGCQLHVC